jgi:hypothetical protein
VAKDDPDRRDLKPDRGGDEGCPLIITFGAALLLRHREGRERLSLRIRNTGRSAGGELAADLAEEKKIVSTGDIPSRHQLPRRDKQLKISVGECWHLGTWPTLKCAFCCVEGRGTLGLLGSIPAAPASAATAT